MAVDLASVESWIAGDFDPETISEAQSLLSAARQGDSDALQRLEAAFSSELSLGGDGVFAPVECGPARLNAAQIARYVAALGTFLHQTLHSLGIFEAPQILVGYDHRASSPKLAAVAAAVACGAGAQVKVFPAAGPTPLLAFAVGHLQAEAGIMITGGDRAAHWNGIKIYLGGRVTPANHAGALLAASTAAAIADKARSGPPACEIAQVQAFEPLSEQVMADYLGRLTHLAQDMSVTRRVAGGFTPPATPPPTPPAPVPGVFTLTNFAAAPPAPRPVRSAQVLSFARPAQETPIYLRPQEETPDFSPVVLDSQASSERADFRIAWASCGGVGAKLWTQALEQAGFTHLQPFTPGIAEDPELGELARPHPRCPELLNPLLEASSSAGADLVVNLGPSGTRVVFALPTADSEHPWYVLDADECALLLTAQVAGLYSGGQKLGGKTPALVSTAVCSNFPRRLAAKSGLKAFAYPSGFSLMCRQGGVRLAYQHNDGFCVDPEFTREADGIATALSLAALAARAKAKGQPLLQRLLNLDGPGGLHVSERDNLTFAALGGLERYMRRLRSGEIAPPDLAGSKVVSSCDLARPCPHGLGCAVRQQVGDPATPLNAVAFLGAGGERVIIHPRPRDLQVSIYVELTVACANLGQISGARAEGRRRIKEIVSALDTQNYRGI